MQEPAALSQQGQDRSMGSAGGDLMIVTFCGHREGYNGGEISSWLDILLSALIAGGADTFYLGGYGSFDELAAMAVWRQKAVYPGIHSILIVPYPNRKHDPALYDSSIYPPLGKVSPRYAIPKRNEWMVSASDVVVSGVMAGQGGSAKTLAAARRKKKVILQYPCSAVCRGRL